MLQTLEMIELADLSAIMLVANFATLVSTYTEGKDEKFVRGVAIEISISWCRI